MPPLVLLLLLVVAVQGAKQPNSVTIVGPGPTPTFDPARGTVVDWSLMSYCVGINDDGSAACNTVAYGPTYRCGWRNAQKCSTKTYLMTKWVNGQNIPLSSYDAVTSDVAVGILDDGTVYGNSNSNFIVHKPNGTNFTRAGTVTAMNNKGSYVLLQTTYPGGIVQYASSAYFANGTQMTQYPGVVLRPMKLTENDELLGAQILQTFVSGDLTGDEIPEVSGVGWFLTHSEAEALGINEKGLYDVDGEVLYPATYYRPTWSSGYQTLVTDVNRLNEILLTYRFGGLTSTKLCYNYVVDETTTVYGQRVPVPWACLRPSVGSVGLYAGGMTFNGLNDWGDVVGRYTPGAYSYSSSYPSFPWVFLKVSHTKWVEYNATDLLPAGSPYEVLSVTDINNNRFISGQCRHRGTQEKTGCIIKLRSHIVPKQLKKPFVVFQNIKRKQKVRGVINLEVAAIDRNGYITKVWFYVGKTKIGYVNSPPYKIEWDSNSVSPGIVTLMAKARDDSGLVGRVKLNIEVLEPIVTTPPPPPTSPPSPSPSPSPPPPSPPNGATVEGEGVISDVTGAYIVVDSVTVYYDSATNIKLNGVSAMAVGQAVQYKAVETGGILLATDIEVA
eukprot:m.232547 g.232547  ORF g.232547 m.232547 type:complete len:612 (+) comp15231_c1_seq1:974-2809(+)